MAENLRTNVRGVEVECTVCHRTKCPRGRSAPAELRMCDYDCVGHNLDPQVGSLWPGESEADFGYAVGNVGIRYV